MQGVTREGNRQHGESEEERKGKFDRREAQLVTVADAPVKQRDECRGDEDIRGGVRTQHRDDGGEGQIERQPLRFEGHKTPVWQLQAEDY